MGITRSSFHKRRATGGKRKLYRKKRKFEMGRPPASTKLGPKRIHLVRGRGGNIKHRALRLDTGNYSWGTESVTRKTRILSVVYNSTNNELVRTNTLVKNSIIQVDATPFRQWYERHYGIALGKKKTSTAAAGAASKDKKKEAKAAKPAKPTKEAKAAKPAKEAKSASKEAKPAKEAKSAKAAKPAKEAKSASKEAKPAKAAKAATTKADKEKVDQQSKPAKEAKPASASKGSKDAKAATQAKVKADVKTGSSAAAASKSKASQKPKRKKTVVELDAEACLAKKSRSVNQKLRKRARRHTIEPALEEQFVTGRLYACISSRPGQSGRCDGYILEGKELEFYLKKIHQKKKSAKS